MDTASAISLFPAAERGAANASHVSCAEDRGRIVLVDWIRGVLILLMASSHAIGLSAVAATSFYTSAYWLPRGWATDAFITVSGMTAAMVYDWDAEPGRACRGVRRRGLQLLVVMYVSNIVLLISKYLVLHEVGRIAHLHWWTGLLTFKTEYSISGVLLPTSAFLLAIPALNYCHRRCGLGAIALGAVSAALLLELAEGRRSHQPLVFWLMHFGAGFPVVPFVATGILGFVVGLAWKRFGKETVLYPMVPCAMLVPTYGIVHPSFIVPAFLPLSRVLLLVIVGCALMQVPGVRRCAELFPLLGRYSLFCFLGHRVLMNGTIMIGRDLRFGQPEYLYEWCMVVTLGLLGCLCFIRTRNERFDRACRKIWL
jgi:hypothetical protein